MRILHTADLHIGKNLDGFSRIEEQEQFLDFLVDKAHILQPDIIIMAGDIFDTANPSAIAETMFYETISRISSCTKSLIVIIAGNHDSPKRLSSARALAKTHGIVIYESHDDDIATGRYKDATILSCNDGVIKVEINGKICNIMAMPYISESRLNESFVNMSDSEQDMAVSFQKKFESIINRKLKYFDDNEYNIMIAHLFMLGSEISDDNLGYCLGGAYIVSSSAIPKEADYTALGHIHKCMAVPNTNKRAYYSGSPIHYNKTEAKTEKKVMLCVDIADNKTLDINKIEIPVYKKIEIWKADNIEDAIAMSEEKKDEDSFVYLEIKTDTVLSNEDIRMIKSNKKDIVEIRPIMTLEKILSTNENMLEKTDEEKFVEFFKEKYMSEPSSNLIKRFLDIASFDVSEK